MSKNNTKAIRIDDNDLLSINQYKIKYNIKTDSDAIRELIKDGLSFNNINNKSLVYFLKSIIDDETDQNITDLYNTGKYLMLALYNLQNLSLFVEKHFYNQSNDTIIFDYKSFLNKCLDQNNNKFMNDLEDILTDQYIQIKYNNRLLYSTKSINLYNLLNNSKIGTSISNFNHIKEIGDVYGLLIDCHYTLNTDNSSRFKKYVYDTNQFDESYYDLINKMTYINNKNVNNYDLYKCIKELYIELNESYLSMEKLNQFY